MRLRQGGPDAGASPDLQDYEGCPALHMAALNDHAKVAKVLLDGGASTEIQCTGNLFTPWHAALFGGRVQVVNLLVDFDADISGDGRTAIRLADDAVRGWRRQGEELRPLSPLRRPCGGRLERAKDRLRGGWLVRC